MGQAVRRHEKAPEHRLRAVQSRAFLVMDEPGAALDLECKEDIRSYLKQYMADGGAVVLTSHELEELSLCSRMYALRDGTLHDDRKAPDSG